MPDLPADIAAVVGPWLGMFSPGGPYAVVAQVLGVWAAKGVREREEKDDRARTSVAYVVIGNMDTALDVWEATHSQSKMMAAWKEALEPVFTEFAEHPEATEEKVTAVRTFAYGMMQGVVNERFVPTYWQRLREPDI